MEPTGAVLPDGGIITVFYTTGRMLVVVGK
jgi:hypothetical protein